METPEASPIEPAAPAPISYTDRLKAFLEAPNRIDDVYGNIANGGDLITYCKMHDIRYSDLRSWLLEGKGRGQRLAEAEHARTEWSRNRVLNELRLIAYVDLREAFTESGDLKKPKDWPDSIARALAAVDVDDIFEGTGKDREHVGYTKKIKLLNKMEALKLIGQELGLFVQKHKVEMVDKLEDLVADSFLNPEPAPEDKP